MLNAKNIANMIDVSELHPYTTVNDIEHLVEKSIEYNFKCVFSLPAYIPLIIRRLIGKDILVGAPIGFPSGGDLTNTKVYQAKEMYEIGCDEFDMVMNIGWLKSRQYEKVQKDIERVLKAVYNKPLKVIIEVTYLTEQEIKEASNILTYYDIDFIKTGTGWSNSSTELKHIEIISNITNGKMKIKAAGGIRDLKTVTNMYSLGVTRFGLGLKSAINIMNEIYKK